LAKIKLRIGDKEIRAWTIKKGISAPKAAGAIHSDMERGFIKAEVYTYKELIQYKSELALKDTRKQGKKEKIILFRIEI